MFILFLYLFPTYANGKSNPPFRQPTLAGDKTILANSDAVEQAGCQYSGPP